MRDKTDMGGAVLLEEAHSIRWIGWPRTRQLAARENIACAGRGDPTYLLIPKDSRVRDQIDSYSCWSKSTSVGLRMIDYCDFLCAVKNVCKGPVTVARRRAT
jgi:hypothetical protein